ncbi:Choline-sulfatase [Rubripirellula obstinata]|uniref:Choline-sulfatase n=1 Tax=Rubripirellula obstinata TaxID=406547 RepID=A0A5B1CK65_9BACT|nr:sulfatase [Rubripirellula obstinata]KAA1260255.1 Choline-sulfatase [Rubripirellula obstinata]
MFRLNFIALVCCAAFACHFEGFANADQVKPKNVLFIVIDDLRPEVNAYGQDSMVTPNWDRLAKKGVKFERAYCQYPVCNPSRSSMMTGKRPDQLGIVSNTVALRKKWPDLTTLPQLFRENGFYTAGLGKLFHAGLDDNGSPALFRDSVSFDYFYDALRKNPEIGKQGQGRILGDGSIPWCKWLAAEGGDEAQPDGMIAAEAVRVLKEHSNQPFFIGVGFHKPHDPFIAPKEYFDHYPIDEIQLAKEPKDRVPLLRHALSNKDFFNSLTEQDQREFKRAYQACTTFSDAQVGKLFDAMDRLKLWDDTIVVMVGDHGYHLGEHRWWNKVTVFELGARVPMILWVPGCEGMGQKTNSVVELLDVYPTLCDYFGLTPPHEHAGDSLRAVIETPSVTIEKPAYTQVVRGGVGMGYSVRSGDWRLTRWGREGQGGYELYDHTQDHLEYNNLADRPEHLGTRNRLNELLEHGFPALKD